MEVFTGKTMGKPGENMEIMEKNLGKWEKHGKTRGKLKIMKKQLGKAWEKNGKCGKMTGNTVFEGEQVDFPAAFDYQIFD